MLYIATDLSTLVCFYGSVGLFAVCSFSTYRDGQAGERSEVRLEQYIIELFLVYTYYVLFQRDMCWVRKKKKRNNNETEGVPYTG